MTVPTLSCAKPTDAQKGNTSGADLVDDFELNEVTVDWLQEQMVNGKYTSAAITQLYINRIDALDKMVRN
jgi:amidase